MVTSLLLMATDQKTNQEEQQNMMKTLHCSSSEGKTRGRKGSVKGPKKQPQRGLGIIQLERLRIQECWKKMNESSSSSSSSGVVVPPNFPDQHHQNFLQCHPQMLPFPIHDPFGNSGTSGGGVPHSVRYEQNHVQVGFQCPQQQVIHGTGVAVITAGQGSFMGNNNNNKSGLSLGGSGGVGGWVVPNHHMNNKFGSSSCGGSGGGGAPFWSPLVGTPLETSTELSSMPNNVHSHHDFLDVCLKKTRFNEDNLVRGSNSRKGKPLDLWPNNNGSELFLGCSPQPAAPNQTSDFYYKPTDATYYNHDEGVEVVAVHRKGNSVSGRVFMEYEFFPGKDARGTASKDLESPTIGSSVAAAAATTVARGDEASPIITTTATPFRNTALNCDYVDLSLKLSR